MKHVVLWIGLVILSEPGFWAKSARRPRCLCISGLWLCYALKQHLTCYEDCITNEQITSNRANPPSKSEWNQKWYSQSATNWYNNSPSWLIQFILAWGSTKRIWSSCSKSSPFWSVAVRRESTQTMVGHKHLMLQGCWITSISSTWNVSSSQSCVEISTDSSNSWETNQKFHTLTGEVGQIQTAWFPIVILLGKHSVCVPMCAAFINKMWYVQTHETHILDCLYITFNCQLSFVSTFHAFKAPTASQQVKCVHCAAATALKGAVESLNRKVSDRWVVMARASVNEAQRMVDDLLLDAVKNKTIQVGMMWQFLNWGRSMMLLQSPYCEESILTVFVINLSVAF